MKRSTFLFLALLPVLFLSCTSHRQEQLQAHLRNGHELYERKLYSEAMVVYSEAEAMALKSNDMYSLGVTYQNIAHIYNAIGSHNEEISYLDKAIRAFEDAGKPYNSLHVYFESGAARYNRQDYASAEKIFRTAMYQAHQAADTLLEAACLEAYAALCLERSEQDPALAISMLARKANELKCPLTSKDRGMLAYAYALTGDAALASEWAEKAVKSAETGTEKAEARFREYQIAYRAGKTEKALEALEQVMEYNNSISAASLKKTVASTREDYEEQQRLNAMYRLRTMRLVTAFIILFAMAISFALIGYIRYRRIETEKALAEEKAETEKYMTIAEELQARLRTIARFDLLERLCEQYYVYEGTENLQGKILKEVKSVIDGLRKDSKTIKKLEVMLDRNCGNLVARLREQMPKLKEEDVRLFIFAASGFSSTTISTILEKEKGIIYNRIWRLKGKISASDAPDKDDFLRSLNN